MIRFGKLREVVVDVIVNTRSGAARSLSYAKK